MGCKSVHLNPLPGLVTNGGMAPVSSTCAHTPSAQESTAASYPLCRYTSGAQYGVVPAVWRRKLKLKAKFESVSSYFTFKR